MRPLLLLPAALLLLLGACQNATSTSGTAATAPEAVPPTATSPQGKTYGAAITSAGAQPLSALPTLLGTQDSAQVKLVGPVQEVCQAKGCWMTMKLADGRDMRVKFKDYAFFVPKDISGKTIVINGWAHRETVPVSDLQHYAKDAGKSAAEIAAITEPQQQLNFEADGVLVQE
ncbi:DUF4920 domain-containing protein [Hymenobacter lapidiphilus]|uniref:DUF4920 domain-containing protein n=1 Tax=Hymenobacter lapidiphilus TaxID=2608003 RepID=A0A7Y7PPT9_9BACT|nr:DUF4920 domain-containing protein [Hymenobacter lapidiphilus]NVO31810.1 DUF4920 domain-containing protein [Hymenobacter lapidiphilus]